MAYLCTTFEDCVFSRPTDMREDQKCKNGVIWDDRRHSASLAVSAFDRVHMGSCYGNYAAVFYRFWDMVRYYSKMPIFIYSTCICRPGVITFKFQKDVWHQKAKESVDIIFQNANFNLPYLHLTPWSDCIQISKRSLGVRKLMSLLAIVWHCLRDPAFSCFCRTWNLWCINTGPLFLKN